MPEDGERDWCNTHGINERWCEKHSRWEYHCSKCGEWLGHNGLWKNFTYENNHLKYYWACPDCSDFIAWVKD